MERWVTVAKKADFYGIAEKYGIDPVTARVMRNRDIISDEEIREYLTADRSCFRDPSELLDLDRAAAVLSDKVEKGARIRIIGDYDIDGIMASYILKRGLSKLGARPDIRIPHRIHDGYGINEQMIREAADDGIDTIITCDNGIAAVEAVQKAKDLGMTVVVTDHHEVRELPPADAVVDPKRPGDTSRNKELCGAAVAWKLMLLLGADPDMELLPFAAFATVGDIMSLTGENRAIVREGIAALRKTQHPGMKALAKVCGMDLGKLDVYHIGFVLGPCFNASGRLDTAMRALSLLEAESEAEALAEASVLKELNESRKAMTADGEEQAVALAERMHFDQDRVMVIYLPEVHESIAGIIAGRIRERYHRPVIILTKGEENVKGSGRSIEGYSMFEELQKCSDLLIRFGGHPMAAGLSLFEDRIDELRARLNAQATLTDEDLMPKIRVDVPMPVSYVSEELIEDLKKLEPFGKGNEKPVFADAHVFCEHPRLFGADRNYLKMRVRHLATPGDADGERLGFQANAAGDSFEAVCFRNARALYERVLLNPDVTLAYEPQINEYDGFRRIQLLITHFR